MATKRPSQLPTAGSVQPTDVLIVEDGGGVVRQAAVSQLPGTGGGSTWHDGAGAPSAGLGLDGDYYLDTASGDVYAKAAGAWAVAGNILGPAGPQGAQGPAGADGATWHSGAGAPAAGLGADGDHYLDTGGGDVYRRAAGAWSVVADIEGPQGPEGPQGEQGPTGADGARWHDGTGAPSAGLGADGDYYLDTGTGDVHAKAGGAWLPAGNIEGPAGPAGPAGADGAAFLSGAGAPAAGLGADGDTYLDTVSGDTYAKSAGVWTATGDSLMGPQGPQGPAGPQGEQGPAGPAGADGVTWWDSQTDPPSNVIGTDGDFALSANGIAYLKDAGTWIFWSNVKGPAGVQGPAGPEGPAGPQGPQGPAGAGVPAGGATGQVLAKNSATDNDTVWVDQTGGGTGGFLSGSGAPDAGAGSDGNHWFNQDNGDLWKKAAGTWSSLGSVFFDAGAQPSAGTDPVRRWYDGSGAPGAIAGVADGDYYRDTASNDVYRRASGAWSVVGSLTPPPVASVNGKTGAVTLAGHEVAVTEDDVAGAYAPVAADLGRIKRYTGSGHTWTIDAVAGVGEIAVENDGTGAITLAVGTATLSGGVTVPAGKSATLRFFAGGGKCKALVEG